MSEWLDLMIDEISRKRSERQEAAEEQQRRLAPEAPKAKPQPQAEPAD
jgi:hypothetical protein